MMTHPYMLAPALKTSVNARHASVV
jgi:hypothetical protein